jgi:hypothetical protein
VARTTSSNYSTPSFPIASVDADAFDANDVQQLAAAVNGHDHTTGKGVVITTGGTGPVKYAEVVLSSAQASVRLPVSGSLPLTYRNIRVTWQARGDNVGSFVRVDLRFNGDTGANYDNRLLQWYQSSGGSTDNSVSAATTSIQQVGGMPGTTPPSGDSGTGEILVPNYSGTTFRKHTHASNGLSESDSSPTNAEMEISAGRWRSTAAITSVTLLPSAGNFITGSTFALYLE